VSFGVGSVATFWLSKASDLFRPKSSSTMKEYGTSHVCVATSQHFHTCSETESLLHGVPTNETESLLHGIPTYETEGVPLVTEPPVVQSTLSY
jgi:hypothetical protein